MTEFAAAKNLFGITSEQHWVTGEGVDSNAFRAMPQRLKDEMAPEAPADIHWERVVFSGGAQGELAVDAHFEGTGWVVTLDQLPMSYNEALLWAKRWGWFGEYGAALKQGHASLRYDYGDMKADLDYHIDCQGATCSIHYSLGSE